MKSMNKTRWASVRITDSGEAVMSLSPASCLYFESVDLLTEAVRKKQIRVRNWIVSVPDNLCITKTVELPATDTEQSYRMLEFELSSYLPLDAEELVYGCVPVSQSENMLKVLVYILKVKTLEDILAKFSSVGIRPSKVMVDSVAIDRWFGQDKNSDTEQINLLFGKEELSISAVKDGELQRHEKISLQEDSLQNQRGHITDEINHLTAEFYTDKNPVLKIAARVDIQHEIKGWFEGNFNTIKFLELPPLDSFVKGSSCPKNGIIFESVITQGLLRAIEDTEISFLNLLPGKTLKRAQQRQLLINTGVSLALLILAVFGLWLNFAVMNWRLQRSCRKITQEIAPIKHIAADVESKRQKVRAIQTQLANRRQISGIFSQLYQYSPKQISISRLSYSSKADTASVSIKGQADTLSNAFEYSDAMKDSELLNNIQIINAQQIPRPGGSIVEFKAECTVRGR